MQTMKKEATLHFYRNQVTGNLFYSFEKNHDDSFQKQKVFFGELVDNKHFPNLELFDEELLITVGKSLHANSSMHFIEKVIMQQENKLHEWNVKEKSKRGFPTVIVLPKKDLPKGKVHFFVCCNEDGIFQTEYYFPSHQVAFPAVMFLSGDGKQYIVRFPDLPDVVGVGNSKEQAFEDAKHELKFALLTQENKQIQPSELSEIKQKHPSAFLIEV